MRSTSRLRLRETAATLIEENRLAPLVELSSRYVHSRLLFWFMAIFAFNRANFRRFSAWVMVALVAEFGFLVPFVALTAVTTGNVLGLPFAAIFVLFIPFFVGFALEASIESEADPELARFRSWFFIQARRTGRVPVTLGEISSSLAPLLRPYTEEEYKAKHRSYRKWARRGLYAMIPLFALYVGIMAVGSPPLRNPVVTVPLLILAFSMLGPTMAADWFEQTKKPVLHDDPSHVIPDQYGPALEPKIQEVMESYESSKVWSGMRTRAWFIYHFGALFAWDTEGFPLVGISLFTLGLYLWVWLSDLPVSTGEFSILVLLVALMPAYATVRAWRYGGGIAKARERKTVYRETLQAATLQDLIPEERLLDVFEQGDYAKLPKEAARDHIIVSLYVRSIPLWPKRRGNGSPSAISGAS